VIGDWVDGGSVSSLTRTPLVDYIQVGKNLYIFLIGRKAVCWYQWLKYLLKKYLISE
jgi:hypothetical protein